MHRIGFLLVCAVAACAPLAAYAQRYSFNIDYDALFELHVDQIIEVEKGDAQPARQLHMPGEVILEARGPADNPQYSGYDMSGNGAVGCYMLLLAEYKKADAICSEVLTDSQSAQLDDGLERVLRFIAENTYPPAHYETVQAYATLQIFQEWLSVAPNTASYCSRDTFLSNFIEYYDGLEGGQFQRDLDEMLEVPRFPVMNPCL